MLFLGPPFLKRSAERDRALSWKEQSGLAGPEPLPPTGQRSPRATRTLVAAGNEATGEKEGDAKREGQLREISHMLKGEKGLQGIKSSKEGGFPTYFKF